MRRALVCGASSGIGRATALALADQGVDIIALSRRLPKLLELQTEIEQKNGVTVTAIACDLSDPTTYVDIVADLLDAAPIHILINNSGGPPSGSIPTSDPRDFERAFHQHVIASHRLLQLVLPGMQASGFGPIINVISTSVREPIPNLGVSNTIRGAMASWAKSVSRELPPHITMNNVLPGFTDTERLRRLKKRWALEKGVSETDLMNTWLAQVHLKGAWRNPLKLLQPSVF